MSGLRPLLLRLHFYAGILAAPFVLVAAVTGLLYTLAPQLDALAYQGQLQVARVGEHPVALERQIAAARAAAPADAVFGSVVLPVDADDTTRVVFTDPTLTDDRERTVFVDPYTGTVQGSLVTWFDSTPLVTWLDDLHRNLHLGDLGRHYSELAASWLGVLAVSGLVLWLATRRRRKRALLVPSTSGNGRGRLLSWHAVVGTWALVGLLFLSVTGLTWSRFAGDHFTAALTALRATAPELDTALRPPDVNDPRTDASQSARQPAPAGPLPGSVSGPASGSVPGSGEQAERVVGIARAAGLDGPLKVTAPTGPATAWSVEQVDDLWPVRKDRAAVDPEAGVVTARADWADRPLLSQLSSLGVLAHMGILFGWVSQLALALLAAGVICLIVWGYRMWWLRRPTRVAGGRPLSPPAAVRRPSVGAVVALGAVAVAAGLAMPLLGVSLLAFLLVDAVLVGWHQPVRERAPVPDPAQESAPASSGGSGR